MEGLRNRRSREVGLERLAEHIGVPIQRVNEIVKDRRGISPETAWLLAQALDTTPEFWSNLQTAHDLATHKPRRRIRKLTRTP